MPRRISDFDGKCPQCVLEHFIITDFALMICFEFAYILRLFEIPGPPLNSFEVMPRQFWLKTIRARVVDNSLGERQLRSCEI